MTVKKLLLALWFITLLFAACKKDNPIEPTYSDSEIRATQNQITMPSTFTQKMLIEMFSSVHCATCPDAEQKFKTISTAHPDRVYGISIHNSDAMEIPLYNFMDSVYSIPYYASGMLNRTAFGGTLVLPKGNWNANINACLNKTASCGLMINTSIQGNTALIDVYSGFNATLSGDYRLTVCLFENNVIGTGPGYNQSNYYNTTANSPFFGLGNPIIGYPHDFVTRKVLSSYLGNPVNYVQVSHGGCIKQSYNINISGYNSNHLYVVAFINKVAPSSMMHEIMNVQQTKLGTNKGFD